jgi:hypothetical protein
MKTMELYAGMDLHSRNTFVGIMGRKRASMVIRRKKMYQKGQWLKVK